MSKFATMALSLSICIFGNLIPANAQCVGGSPATSLTSTDETANFSGTRMLIDGLGTTVDTSVAGKIKVNVSSLIAAPQRVGWWTPLTTAATTFSAVGMTAAPTASGTAANASGASGNLIKYTTATTLAAVGGIRSTAFTDAQYQYSPTFATRVRTSSSGVTSQRIWVGLAASNPSGSATPTANIASFRYDTGAGDSTWKCVSSNASTNTITDSGVTVAASSTYDLSLDTSDPAKVVYFINGAAVATITTNLPVSSTNIGPNISITNLLAGTARDLSVGTTRIQCY